MKNVLQDVEVILINISLLEIVECCWVMVWFFVQEQVQSGVDNIWCEFCRDIGKGMESVFLGGGSQDIIVDYQGYQVIIE